MEILQGHFKDSVTYDSNKKTAISVRDGVLEYAGSEIGQSPSDKLFKVYRSPATLANTASLMANIPLTNEHVNLESEVSDPKGKVSSATVIDVQDSATKSKLAIQNMIDINDEIEEVLKSGKRELSLGYMASLEPYEGDDYDFEQKNIEPHHLAVVDQGRCGSMCSFIDKKLKDKNMNDDFKKLFCDAEGMPNIKQIMELVRGLESAIGNMTPDDLKKLVPILMKVNEKAGLGNEEEPATTEESEPEVNESENQDAEKDLENKDSEEKVEDKKDYKDSAEFKDAIIKASVKAVNEYAEVVEKARNFVDENYSFKDKSTEQVMRDALATEHGTQHFSDEELNVAFKLLKHTQGRYANFADGSNKTKLSSLRDKEY